jgi:DNA-binding NarL/FixJ family response regulator
MVLKFFKSLCGVIKQWLAMGYKLLLVEDDAGFVSIFKEEAMRALGRKEFSDIDLGLDDVEVVGSVGEARELLVSGANGYDAILLDLGLPDSFGLEGLESLLKEFPEAPIIVLTGNDDPVMHERALEIGAKEYLVKDYVDGRTIRRVLNFVRGRKAVLAG